MFRCKTLCTCQTKQIYLSLRLSLQRRKQNACLYDDHRNLGYMINFLSEIYAIKRGKRMMPFLDFVKLPEKPKKWQFFRKKKMWNNKTKALHICGALVVMQNLKIHPFFYFFSFIAFEYLGGYFCFGITFKGVFENF